MATDIDLQDLNTDSALLDPNFNGYKLNLDMLPVYDTQFVSSKTQQPSTEQFSLHHAKIFAAATSLFEDTFFSTQDKTVLFATDEDGAISKCCFDHNTKRWNVTKVTTVSNEKTNWSYPASLFFCEKDIAVYSDGNGNVKIYQTEDERDHWKVVQEFSFPEKHTFFLEDCRFKDKKITLLCHFVERNEKTEKSEKTESLFENRFSVVVITPETCENVTFGPIWCPGVMDSAVLSSDLITIVMIASKAPYGVTKPMEITEEADEKMEDSKTLYIWTESGEEVSILIQLAESVRKEDIDLTTTDSKLVLKVDGALFIDGKLGGTVKPSETVWTLDDKNILDITLFKTSELIKWSYLIHGDTQGRFELDPDSMSQSAGLLSRFTSETTAIGEFGANKGFNSEQLEDCDMTEDDLTSIYWFNWTEDRLVSQCEITGNQFLFATRPFNNEVPRLCLRYDVDGVLLSMEGLKHRHIATFNALGYVQASKSLRRWSDCAPNFSYAVIAESQNHVFIYHQPNELTSELRNRKTNTPVNTVARQQLFSLKARSEATGDSGSDLSIHSIRCTNTAIFLMTSDKLYAVMLR